MKTGRLTRDALFTSLALILFTIEAQIPLPVPVPGVKLGLANIVTVWAMFRLGAADALAILISRVLLGSLFAASPSTLLYSLTGGLSCFALTLILRRILTQDQIWVCGVLGAVAHNAGQLAAAVLVTGTPGLWLYLPILTVSGMIAGLFTGLCAQYLIRRGIPKDTISDAPEDLGSK